ncbi:Biotin ECF transporter S component BioY2 [uncultured Eubacterium sp.]|nr:Biotin ECF transporter S component BioY2 [uncultured Eubacterium sp.]
MTTITTKRNKTYDMVCIAIFAVLMAVCSWIAVPTTVPFTMQTFGLFLTVGVLGGKRGTLAILIFILLGAVGIPVFSGFTGGLGILFGTTGGYIIGFIFSGLVMWAMEKLIGRKTWALALAMVLAMIVYFTFGTAWFMAVYGRTVGPIGLSAVLGWCVLPFVIPDILKMMLALMLSGRLSKIIER